MAEDKQLDIDQNLDLHLDLSLSDLSINLGADLTSENQSKDTRADRPTIEELGLIPKSADRNVAVADCANPWATTQTDDHGVVVVDCFTNSNTPGQRLSNQPYDFDDLYDCCATGFSDKCVDLVPPLSDSLIEGNGNITTAVSPDQLDNPDNLEHFESLTCKSIDDTQEFSHTSHNNSIQPQLLPNFSHSIPSLSDEHDTVKDSMTVTVAFEIDFSDNSKPNDVREMPKKAKNSLQEAFLHFRKKRQDEIRQERRRRDAILEANADPVRMSKLREKIIAQAKRYFGVPYARKYWQPNTPEYNSPIFLDCCGLVRQVIRDLQDELGFRLGPWNQAYMFDTLPVTLTKRQMRPGDLVFMTGEYVNPKKKKQRHNMLHVEIWLGEGDKTIGSRWNNGKVSTFNSYKFDPKSFQNEQYIFKSIDTWLMGICHSYCPKHPWRLRKVNPSAKSIFNIEDTVQDEKASPDSDEETADRELEKGRQSVLQQDGGESEGDDGQGGGGGFDSSLLVEDVAVDLATGSGDVTPNADPTPLSRGQKARMPSPRKFKASLRNRIQASGPSIKINSTRKDQLTGHPNPRQKNNNGSVLDMTPGALQSSRPSHSRGSATLTMDHDAIVCTQPQDLSTHARNVRKSEKSVGDLTLLRAAANRRITATIVTSVRCHNEEQGSLQDGDVALSSVLREITEEEINYIPNRLPSRSGARMTNAWRTSKDREVQARHKVIPVEHHSQRCGARIEAWAPSGITNKRIGNSVDIGDSPLSVVGSKDSLANKSLFSPNNKLQSSETNLLFRTNTNFFKVQPNNLATNTYHCNQEDKEKTKWRLSSRISPEPVRDQSKVGLNLDLVREKLKDTILIDDIDYCSGFDSEDDDIERLGSKDDISKCLIIQKSPRIQPSNTTTPLQVSAPKTKLGKGKKAKGNAFKRVGFPSVETDIVSTGRKAPVFLSTSILQSALCLSPGDEGFDAKAQFNKTKTSNMPPVDDSSVVVRAGTASQLSSRQGSRVEEFEKKHGVKNVAKAVTSDIAKNRQDGQVQNPLTTPSLIKTSADKSLSKDAARESTTSFYTNEQSFKEAKIVSTPGDVFCAQTSENVESSDTKKPDVRQYKKPSILPCTREYINTIPESILKVFSVQNDDECGIENTSFSSDLSFEDLAPADSSCNIMSLYDKGCKVTNISEDVGTAAKLPVEGISMKAMNAHGYLTGRGISDGGDCAAALKPGISNREVEISTGSQLQQSYSDADTDDEIESGLSLTSLHHHSSCQGHHLASGDAGGKETTGVSHGAAAVGKFCKPGSGDKPANPAWDWLYSFPHNLVSTGCFQGEPALEDNVNNNSSAVVDALFERGTSLCVRADEGLYGGGFEWKVGDGDNASRNDLLSPGSQSLPPLHPRYAASHHQSPKWPILDEDGQKLSLTSARLGNDRCPTKTIDHFAFHFNHPNLLANYVLSQQPKCQGSFHGHEEEDNALKIRRCGFDRDTFSYHNDMDVQKAAEFNGRLGTPLSDSGADTYSMLSDERLTVTSSTSTLDESAYSQQENPPSYFEKLRRQEGLRLRKGNTPARQDDIDCRNSFGLCQDRNNNGVEQGEGQSGRDEEGKKPAEGQPKLIRCQATLAPNLKTSELYSDLNATAALLFNNKDLTTQPQQFGSVGSGEIRTSGCRPSGLVSVGNVRDGEPNATIQSEGEAPKWPPEALESISSFVNYKEINYGPGGASAKSQAGKQCAGSQSGGPGGDKPTSDKQQSSSDAQPDGAGEDGGKGVGRGGGGGGGGGAKRPGRSSKLPQCCLPNNMQPTFYIGGGNGTALVEAPLLNLGWKRITDKNDERYRLKWVENKSRINYVAFREGEQLVNHIPNCKLLTNKLGLLCSLQEYERVTLLTKGRTPRMKMTDFIPETYKLDERIDREKFLSEYNDGETWICKPTSLNQGKGIFLLRSREEINNLLSERDAKQQSGPSSRQPLMRIVQRYINKPMLLDNRKFDIRAYMMVASTVPYLVVFHQGYVRLSCQRYDQADTNLTTHLTNQFVQKKDPMYKDNKEDTAWTMDKFNDYINDHVAKEKGLDQDWVYGFLTKQMQRISLHCFNSVKHKLQCKIGYFDLYGLDFMVDDEMKVWLIEINANPALHTNCNALKDAIPPVVEHGLYLAVECFDKSRKGQPLLPLNSLANFTVLYCGASPNAHAPRQIRSVSPFKDAGEWGSRPTGTSSSTRRYSPPRNLPRMGTMASSTSTAGGTATNTATTGQATVVKQEKKENPSSILPTINIGTSLGQKSTSAGTLGGGSSNSTSRHHQQQQHQPSMQQREATLARVSLSGVTSAGSEEQHRLRMTHADPSSSVRKSRDNPLRGN